MAKQHWMAEKNSIWKSPEHESDLRATSGVILRYDPTPEPVIHPDGSMSLSITFPALAVTAFVADPGPVAANVARKLNTYGQLLETLKACASRLEYLGDAEEVWTIDAKAAIAAAEAPLEPL